MRRGLPDHPREGWGGRWLCTLLGDPRGGEAASMHTYKGEVCAAVGPPLGDPGGGGSRYAHLQRRSVYLTTTQVVHTSKGEVCIWPITYRGRPPEVYLANRVCLPPPPGGETRPMHT